jgi:dihydroorotate dehydrogenase subfamily 1
MFIQGDDIMADMRVSLGDLKLRNPIIVASGPLTSTIDRLKKAEECGAAGVSLKHTMLKQEFKSRPRWYVDRNMGMIVTGDPRLAVEDSLKLIKKAKEQTELAVLVNMSGLSTDPSSWGSMAKMMEEAGADAIELNLNCPNLQLANSTAPSLGANLGANPESTAVITKIVKEAVHIPVIAKLSTEGGALTRVAEACVGAGIDILNVHAGFRAAPALDIYNGGTFLYPGSSTGNFGGSSGPWSRLISNRFVADIARAFSAPIIGGGGISKWEHIVESIMYGSTAVQICTSIMFNGFELIKDFTTGINQFMEITGYSEINSMKGLALKNITAPGTMPNTDIFAQISPKKCVGCHICEKLPTCDAIRYNITDKKCSVNPNVCVGCGLCMGLCPSKAIKMVLAQ